MQADAPRSLTQETLDRLLERASQPRHVGTNDCTRLCGFVQRAAKSRVAAVREIIFNEDTSLNLFTFYLEWSEIDQHRSMGLVLDALSLLISKNQNPEAGFRIRGVVLDKVLSVLARRDTKPLVKSSLGCLNYLLSKSVCSIEETTISYMNMQKWPSGFGNMFTWGHIVATLFSWMDVTIVSQVAAKLILTVLKRLRDLSLSLPDNRNWNWCTVGVWHEWLEHGLGAWPGILDSVKNYILAPLFKFDRPLALELLERCNQVRLTYGDDENLEAGALLQLIVLQMGKKSSLVEEPGESNIYSCFLRSH